MGDLIGIQATRAALLLGDDWCILREWCVTARVGTSVLADPLYLGHCPTPFCRTFIYVPDGDSQVGWAEHPPTLCWDSAKHRWTNTLSFGRDGTAVLSVVPVYEGDPLELVRFEARLQLAGAAEKVIEVYHDIDDEVATCPEHLFFDWPPGTLVQDYPEAGDALILSGVLAEAGMPGAHLPPLLNLYLEIPDCAGQSYELCLPLYWLTSDDRDRGGWYGAFWWEGSPVRLYVDREGATGTCCPVGVMDPAGTLLGDRGQFDLVFRVYTRTNQARYAEAGNHTWTCPGGVTAVIVETVGGGGCGGAGDGVSRPGGGGGGGGYAVRYAIPVTPTSNYTATVGKAPAYTDPGGRDGGDSTFTGDGGASVTGAGGKAGEDDSEGGQGGAGGTGTGDYVDPGWPGHDGMVADEADEADGAGGVAGGPAQSSYGHGGRGRVSATGEGTQGTAGYVTLAWGDYAVTQTAVTVQCIDPVSNIGNPGHEAFRFSPQEKVYDYYGNASYAPLDLGNFWGLGFACADDAEAPPLATWAFQVGSWFTVFLMSGEDSPCGVGTYPRVRVLTVGEDGASITGYDGEFQHVGFRIWPGGEDSVIHGESQFTNMVSCCDHLDASMTALYPLPMPRTLRCHCHSTGNIATGDVTYLWIEEEESGTWDGTTATWVFDVTVPDEQRQYARDFGHLDDPWEKAMWERVRVTLTWTEAAGWQVVLDWWGWSNLFLAHYDEEPGTVESLEWADWPFRVAFRWQEMDFWIDNQAFAHRQSPLESVTVQFAELCAPVGAYVGGWWRDGLCICDLAPTFCPACAELGVARSHYHVVWNGVTVHFAWSEKCSFGAEYDPIPGGAGGTGLRLRLFTGPSGGQYAGIFPVTGAAAGDPLYASSAEDFAAWTCQTTLTLTRQYASGVDPATLTLTPGHG